MKNRLYKLLFLSISTTVVATTSFALISPSNTEANFTTTTLELPSSLNTASSIASIDNDIALINISSELKVVPDSNLISVTHKVEKNESLSTIFSKLELSQKDLHYITHANNLGKQFATIKPGKELIANINSDGQLQQLIYKKNPVDTLQATRNNNKFTVELISKPIVKVITSAQTDINSSLFLDGKEAKLTDKLIMQLADIFAWDIDFALNLRKGDKFTVVYEKILVDNKEIDTGNIISAEFINKGKAYTAVRFEDKQGNANYFTPDGKSMRKDFLRTPVDFSRISSHFNLKRKHPILNTIRAHKGVDYAASTGTQIKTTGKGKITYRGRKGGYGNVVIVQHGQKYSTLYAHLSKFRKGQKVGNYVQQGQVIGYVGQTGRATGPHLHYEFRVNGIHRNPLTVKLPHAQPIDESLLAEFKEQTQPLLTQLNKAKATDLVAQNNL